MKIPFLRHVLTLSAAVLLSGCIMSGIAEKQGRNAYLQKDYATARMRFEEAAAEDNADALYHLAGMYVEGKGVPRDYAKAASLLERASAQGHAESRLMLGLFYLHGDGVEQDAVRGADLIKAAAADGNDVAMYYLGSLYAGGIGIKKDLPAALHWMRKARDAGFPVRDELLTEAGLAALHE